MFFIDMERGVCKPKFHQNFGISMIVLINTYFYKHKWWNVTPSTHMDHTINFWFFYCNLWMKITKMGIHVEWNIHSDFVWFRVVPMIHFYIVILFISHCKEGIVRKCVIWLIIQWGVQLVDWSFLTLVHIIM
jgi:hypothetical protein